MEQSVSVDQKGAATIQWSHGLRNIYVPIIYRQTWQFQSCSPNFIIQSLHGFNETSVTVEIELRNEPIHLYISIQFYQFFQLPCQTPLSFFISYFSILQKIIPIFSVLFRFPPPFHRKLELHIIFISSLLLFFCTLVIIPRLVEELIF